MVVSLKYVRASRGLVIKGVKDASECIMNELDYYYCSSSVDLIAPGILRMHNKTV